MRVRAAAAALSLCAVAGCAQAGSVDPEAGMLTSPGSRAAAPTTTAAPVPTAGPALPAVPPPSASTSLLSRLVGHKWLMTAWSQDGKAGIVPQRAAILFTPTAIDAYDGCNDIEGEATYAGATVRLSPLMSSAVGCGDDPAGLLDRASDVAFVDSLQLELNDSTLTVAGHGVQLTYTRGPAVTYPPDIGLEPQSQSPLYAGLEGQIVGPLWRLDTFTVGATKVVTAAASRASMLFGAAFVTADDGCNDHDVSLTYRTGTLLVGNEAVSAVACTGPGIDPRVSTAYRTLFAGSVDARLSGGTLTLSGNGVSLTLSKTAPRAPVPSGSPVPSVAPLATVDPSALRSALVGRPWRLVSVTVDGMTTPVPTGLKAAMKLTETTYSLLDGCADHVGLIHYTLTGVAITDQGVKGEPCAAAPAVAAAYETVLTGRPRFQFDGHGITLGSGSTVLTFQ